MKKILIIDRSGEEEKAISSSLIASGYEIMEADNIFRAAAILGETKFDLILCSQKFFFADRSPLQSIILEDARHSKIILLQEDGEELPAGWHHPRIIGLIKKPTQLEKLLEVISLKVHKVGFTGMVHDIDLMDYMQLLAMNKTTKAFVVEAKSGSGVLVFFQGNIIYASYGGLRGELAFHAMVALLNGKIVDKRLKHMPKPNISKSFPKLLLEANINRDETAFSGAENETDDFLLDKMDPTKESTPHSAVLHSSSTHKNIFRNPLALGLLCLFFLAFTGGALLKFFPSNPGKNIPVVLQQATAQSQVHIPEPPLHVEDKNEQTTASIAPAKEDNRLSSHPCNNSKEIVEEVCRSREGSKLLI